MASEDQMVSTVSAREARLNAAVRATHRRLLLRTALVELARSLPIGLACFAVFSALFRVGWITRAGWLSGGGIVLVVVVVLTYRALRKAPGPLSAALLLDRTHAAMGRLSTIWEGTQPRARGGTRRMPADLSRNGFFLIVEEELSGRGPFLPHKAVPLAFPGGLATALALAGVSAAVLFFPLPASAPPSLVGGSPTATPTEAWLSEDDGELLQRTANELVAEADSEQGKDAASRFNEIVLSVVSGKLTQKEAFRLAAELEADLQGTAEEAAQLHRGLERRGESLAERAATREVGQALREQRYADAAEALKKLAERLKSGDQGLSQKELEQLRQSLEELRKDQEKDAQESGEASNDAQRQALERRKKELEDKQKQGQASAAEQKELEETERKLKRLDRQKAAQNQAEQTLSQLDKELAEAARELLQEQQKSGQFLDQASKTVSSAAKRTLSEEEKKEMLKQLRELKERLRRQGQKGNQDERLKNFQKRARGGQPQSGDEQEGQGQGKKSQQKGNLQVRLGPGGVPLPGMGKGPGKPGEEEGEGDAAASGKDPGQGHDPQVAGEESRLPGARAEDTMAVAQDSGSGQSESETIVTAAEEGFTQGAYEKLYRKYETVAEEVMERESIPPGRKAHVQRYFELIRPRGDAPLPQKEK